MSINVGNLKLWTDALRSDEYQQINGALAKKVEGDTWAYCCLGVGCLIAGIEKFTPIEADHVCEDSDCIDYHEPDRMYFGMSHQEELPPGEFHDWLGVQGADSDDVYLDWPKEYEELTVQDNTRTTLSRASMSAASLNDSYGLTFPQIADMFDYFGITNTN